MKNIAILLLIFISTVASATDYYISPSGNDSNNGSIAAPFFTLNKAWSVVKAGDVIFARGGLYQYNQRQNLTDKNGTSSDTIRIQAYPGERPVFTKSSSFSTPSWPVCLIYVSANYIHLKGIEVTNFKQASATIWYGIAVRAANHNKFEEIKSHHNGHGMVIRDESGDNLVINSDFHHNYDPLTSGDGYGNADGIEVGYQSASMENTVKNCRLWNNSDDGVDLWNNNGNVIIDNCWSWNNGYREDGRTQGGDGGGFKFGTTTTLTGTEFKRTIKNCLSVYNRTKGYNQNGAKSKFYFYNNIAYKNPQGIVFYTDNLPNIYKNNIVFGNNENWVGQYSNSIKDHNSFDASLAPSGPVASASDFLSIDTAGISGKRGSDGSLPAINFLRLSPGSDLIDAGTNVGIAYNGTAPDLGPFETFKDIASGPATQVLTYVSSSVKSTTPTDIEVKYNTTLATISPAASCFDVKVNSVSRAVNKLTLLGQSVNLTLAAPVLPGDAVILSYTKPSVNPLQCTGGTQAETITAKAVTNPLSTAAPLYVSSTVENSTPDKIDMIYDVKLANIVPAASSFTPKVNGVIRSVKAVTVTENKVTLTLNTGVNRLDTVTLTYVKPATNPLQTAMGGKAEAISEKPVANNILGVITEAKESLINDGKIMIFPNPASDFIKIANFSSGDQIPVLKIFDFSGKLCQEIKLENMTRMSKIPISLKSGMYITQLLVGSIVQYVQKIIIVK